MGGPADRHHPRPGHWQFGCIDSGFGNAGKRHVQGLEATATYELPTEHWGKFTFSGGYNHFFTWKAQPGTGPFHSFLGNYDNGTLPFVPGAIPWNKGFLRGEWEWRHFDFIATGNYIGDFRDDPSLRYRLSRDEPPECAELHHARPAVELRVRETGCRRRRSTRRTRRTARTSCQPAADTSGGSIWQRLLWGTTLTVGVNNAFDRNPPTVLAAPNDNYDTSLYSIRNRYLLRRLHQEVLNAESRPIARTRDCTSTAKSAPRWNRTNNPVIKSHLLCQLS